MADKTIVSLTELPIVTSDDVFPIVDITDLTDGPNGTTKKIKQQNISPDKAPLNSPIFTGTVTIPSLNYGAVLITITGVELNYLAGVTSALQAQLDGKQPLNANLTTIGGLADPNADEILFWDDSASSYAYLTVGSGLQIVGTTMSIVGGGGGYTLTDKTSGNIDGVNKTFGFPSQPLFVVSDGVWYRVNAGWTWDGAHVVMTIPPNNDLYSLS